MKKNKKLMIKILILILLGFPMFLNALNINYTAFTNDNNVFIEEKIENDYIELEITTSNVTVEEIEVSSGDVFHRITIDEGSSLGQVGYPKVPFKTLKVLLPFGKDIEDIIIELGNEETIEGTCKIEPAQAPLLLGSDEKPEFNIRHSAYDSSEPYPEKLYSVEGVQELRGYRILILNVFPVRYLPKFGTVSYFENITVLVKLTNSALDNPLYRACSEDEERVLDIVENPEVIFTYREALTSESKLLKTSSLPSGSFDYVIITNEELKNSNGACTFQDLAALKNSKGIKTTIVTTEEIYANYSGMDNQTKIRNFIIDAYQNWGIEYVLLGGDGDGENLGGESEAPIIPSRGFYYASPPPVPEPEYNIPSDLYYAALDGSWNDDGDALWGEPGEDDLYAEVYVGRAPVDSEEELSNFINKTITHEEADDPYLAEALMVGEYMGASWPAWGGEYMDEIKDGSSVGGYSTAGFPDSFNVSTLYDRDYYPSGWTKDDLIPILNDGVHLVNHLGHSAVNWNMRLYNDDVDNLNNDKYYFLYTQGCYPGAFDNREGDLTYRNYDCIAEHHVTSSNGAFAVIANSRSGVGSPYDTNGASQHLNREFIDAVFRENLREIGKANQDSKEDSIGSISQYYMRYCYYGLTLFGDPTTSFYPEPNNNAPTLSNEAISQVVGYQNTPLNFSVVYTDIDNNTPSYIDIIINGTVFSMEKQDPTDIDYTDGCVYHFLTYLQPASHNYTYYFKCNDGEYRNSTSTYNNIQILYSNDESPTLTSGRVNPDRGLANLTTFEFSVIYTDLDNNAPEYVNVTLDSMLESLTKQDPLDFNYMDGCVYVYRTELAKLGVFRYNFSCYDGESTENDGPYTGPVVNRSIPFDGMYLNYTMRQSAQSEIMTIFYSHHYDSLFSVNMSSLYYPNMYYYDVDYKTRIFHYPTNSLIPKYTPFWIFTNVSLGDLILISCAFQENVPYSISGDLICDIPGLGLIEVWVLKDIRYPDAFLWYDKSTGILVNGTFYYYDALYEWINTMSFELINMNAKINNIQDLAPNADFIASERNIIEKESVQFNFTGYEGNGPATYKWEFGDGHESTEQNPMHRYDTPGNYNVTLTINDYYGEKDIEIKDEFIIVYEDIVPIADFSVNDTLIFKDGIISFKFNGSIGNGPATHEWDFGDGSVLSYEENPEHQYTTPGIYSVLLIITDLDEDINIKFKGNLITVIEDFEDLTPLADFLANTTTILNGDYVQFIFNGSEGDDPASYYWDFGDGSDPSYERNPEHQYTTPGIYSVLLITTDSDGDFDHVLRTSLIIVKGDVDIPPGIPGYDTVLIICAISVVSAVLILKRRFFLKNN